MERHEAVRLLGLLADRDRLRVAAAVVLGDRETAQIRATTGLGAREVDSAMRRLDRAGLVQLASGGWQMCPEVLAAAARGLIEEGREAMAAEQAASGPEAGVLRSFLRQGRLLSIPAGRRKRRVVLEHLSGLFEPGIRYTEREVDTILRAVHPDHAALRRYLVDEDFLARERGVYWRSGGRVEV